MLDTDCALSADGEAQLASTVIDTIMAGLPGPRGAPGPVGPPGDSQGWAAGLAGREDGHSPWAVRGPWVPAGRGGSSLEGWQEVTGFLSVDSG